MDTPTQTPGTNTSTSAKKNAATSSKKPRIIKALASIKLGVVIIIALGCLTAWGTFVEAQYGDAVAAQKIVYHSVWMFATMIALATSLIAVMIDRWPWTQKHTGFVLAHIGIIVIMLGSLITKYQGLDGSISFGIGEGSKLVSTAETELAVFATLGDGSGFTNIYRKDVDFFLRPPSEQKPYDIEIPNGKIRIIKHHQYAFRDEKVVESDREQAGAGVRFQLQNPRVSLTEWLVQPGPGRDVTKDLGPAQVILTTGQAPQAQGRNAIVLRPGKSSEELQYEIHTASNAKNVKKGVVKAGDVVETGWMGLTLRLLKYLPKAQSQITFKPTDAKTDLTMEAIEVEYEMTAGPEKGKNRQWMGGNSMLRLFSDQASYIVTYGNRRIELPFELQLKDFRVGRYQGTLRAASYESLVQVPNKGEILISMNEPLKHEGFTFYQASFVDDEQGRPIASVLSVNRDPGRWIKYLGSLLIVLGTIHLFYFKRKTGAKNVAGASDSGTSAAKGQAS